ncbi:MAG TPA: hypothetical protein VLB44_03385, partial [Kofleriaceae bacterium]|nr:hypothetical protein [Kofleriaceae bacterium]
GDKVDAKALMSSGLKLFAAKDYLGALAVFKDAYQRFPSSKILLNIGTTLKALNRNAEAANVYQRYLDAPDIDAAKKADVAKVLAELDATLGVLDITVKPDDAEVQIGTDDWIAAKEAAHYRINPGSAVVHARRADHTPGEKSVDVAAGAHAAVALELAAVPVATITPTTTTSVTTTTTETDTGISASTTPETPPGKLGFFAYEHVDIQFKGAATFVGASYEVLPKLGAELAGIIGPKPGAYLGARYAILPGMFRPIVAVGMPLFFSNGARVAVRGAGGLEVAVHRHVSLVAEVGVEHWFNPEANFASTTFIPALGAVARL